MSPSRSRRRVLRALAASSLFGLAGCATDSSPSDSTANSSPNQPTRTSSGLDTATPTPKPSIATSPAQSTTSQSNTTTTPDSTTSRTNTPEPDTSTYGPTSGPDERETRTPPGSPSLESRSKWPAFRFDAANTGYNPDGTGLREAEQYWRLAPTSSASLNAETLFSVSSGDEDSKSFTRRDPATNDIRSRTQLVQYGVNAPPTVVGDRVFVTTFVEVFCLAANRDAVVWRGPEMDGIQAPPAVADGTVYVNSGGFTSTPPQLRAFDAATGDEQWRYDTGSRAYTTPAVANDRVFIASNDGLHAVDAASGERSYLVEDVGRERATPVVSTDSVYIISRGERTNDQLVTINVADGSVRWRERFSDLGRRPPVIANDLVYVGTESGVAALDAATGRKATSIGGSGSPVARVGEVLYTTGEGTLFALDVTGGSQLWSHTTEQVRIQDTVGRTIAGVTPVSGAVYVSARDGFHGFGPV